MARVRWSRWYRSLALYAIVGAIVEIGLQLVFLWLLDRDDVEKSEK